MSRYLYCTDLLSQRRIRLLREVSRQASLFWIILSIRVFKQCSLLFFLNHIEKIRRNKGLSFLTFSGIPAVCLILLIIYILVGFYKYHMVLDPLKMLLLFSVIYLASTILEFILFRKIIKKQQADPKVQ